MKFFYKIWLSLFGPMVTKDSVTIVRNFDMKMKQDRAEMFGGVICDKCNGDGDMYYEYDGHPYYNIACTKCEGKGWV